MSASRSSDSGALGGAQLLGEWARLLFASLRDAGVVDVWVSPGSRSTPFTWAAQHTPGLELRVVVDERSAAFLALGHTRVTGRPCALLCTSGSAAANYFPAIVEASLAHLPLVALTADRPPEVQHAAAAQTIDQLKLYGDHVRCFFDLGLPDASASALAGLRRSVVQAVAQSLGPLPGPVHLNLRARKPLEPAPAETDAERALSARVTELIAKPLARHAPATLLANEAVLAAARTLSGAASGAIVVGPLSAARSSLAAALGELSELLGFPIFAEASSQARFALAEHPLSAPHFDWFLSTPGAAERHRPDVLLCVGQTPTSSAFERWAAHVPKRLVLAEHGLPDALGTAELVASGDLSLGLPALIAALKRTGHAAKGSAFSSGIREMNALCAKRIAEALAEPTSALSEAAAVKAVVESLPDGSVLALGNSLPIRDVDAYVTAAAKVSVTAQRGANGIDGLVSGAIGSAIGRGVPTLLLLGDVSLLHDVGGLAAARLAQSPLVIAVVDNAGGRIFDQLPVQQLYGAEPEAAKLWLTPTDGALFSHAAALFSLHYEAPTTPAEIRAVTARALARSRPTLLHLRVGPDSAAGMRRQILARLTADLAEMKA
jgi:2-succinyl-5-enolpyruvyl-6-hydroxy-3-cyclohexene-1-carboxylate synthase